MQISDVPSRLLKAFADSGTKNTIPVDSQISVTPGAASLTDGFPPLTMTPLAAGGVPPYGADFNGILNWVSKIAQWTNAGGQYTYDSAFATAIGGYPKGSVLLKSDYSGSWVSTADNNTTNPDAGGAGWTTYGGMAYVSTAPGTQINGTDLVYVKDRDQILRWQTIGTFTGYASPQVGLFHWGTTTTPRPFEELLIGQTIDASLAKYAALFAWANAQGLVVASGSWLAGTYNWVNNGDGTYKMPDLRNMFIRATGTDADTANARSLGSYQAQNVQLLNLNGELGQKPTNTTGWQNYLNTGSNTFPLLYNLADSYASQTAMTNPRNSVGSGSDTRSANAAFVPVVCL